MNKIELAQIIETAVNEVALEITKNEKKLSWELINEELLFYHLISCILGSNVKYEVSQAFANLILKKGLCKIDLAKYSIEYYYKEFFDILTTKIQLLNSDKTSKYRFPKIRTDNICKTIQNIYLNNSSIKEILFNSIHCYDARNKIIKNVSGVGPKQASMFLRNIGYTKDLAILDTHVLKFINLIDNNQTNPKKISNLNYYQSLEKNLQDYAASTQFKLATLDYAIWITMRVYQEEFS